MERRMKGSGTVCMIVALLFLGMATIPAIGANAERTEEVEHDHQIMSSYDHEWENRVITGTEEYGGTVDNPLRILCRGYLVIRGTLEFNYVHLFLDEEERYLLPSIQPRVIVDGGTFIVDQSVVAGNKIYNFVVRERNLVTGEFSSVESMIRDIAGSRTIVGEDYGGGLEVLSDGTVSLTDTVVQDSAGHGVNVLSGAGAVDIVGSTIQHSAGHGVNVLSGAGAVNIVGSTIEDNGGDGVYVGALAGPVSLTDTTVNGSAGHGVNIMLDSGPVDIVGSTIEHSGGHGVNVNRGAGSVDIVGSTIRDNTRHGVNVTGAEWDGSIISLGTGPVTLEDSDFINNGEFGVFVFHNSVDIIGCEMHGNTDGGLYLGGLPDANINGNVEPYITWTNISGGGQGVGIRISNPFILPGEMNWIDFYSENPSLLPRIENTTVWDCDKGLFSTFPDTHTTVIDSEFYNCEYGMEVRLAGRVTAYSSIFHNNKYGKWTGHMAYSTVHNSDFVDNWDTGVRDACPGSIVKLYGCYIANNEKGFEVEYRDPDWSWAFDYKAQMPTAGNWTHGRTWDSTVSSNQIGFRFNHTNTIAETNESIIPYNVEMGANNRIEDNIRAGILATNTSKVVWNLTAEEYGIIINNNITSGVEFSLNLFENSNFILENSRMDGAGISVAVLDEARMSVTNSNISGAGISVAVLDEARMVLTNSDIGDVFLDIGPDAYFADNIGVGPFWSEDDGEWSVGKYSPGVKTSLITQGLEDASGDVTLSYNMTYDLQSDTVYWWKPPIVVHHPLSAEGVGISLSHGLDDGVYTFESVSFSVYGVDDAMIAWDMGDGTTLFGMDVEHFYTESELYLITATINVGDEVYIRQALLAVHNRPPVAVIDLYQKVWADVSIAGTPGNTVQIRVYEDDDVVADTSLVRARGQPDCVSLWFPVRPGRNYTFSMSLQGEGANPFILDIWSENSTSGGQNLVRYEGVLNSQKFPNFTMDLEDVSETVLRDNRRIIFDGSMNYDVDGYITDYYWMLDNETWVEGAYQEYVYPEQGSYTVHLFVLDNHNANGSASASFNIRSRIGGDFELMPDYRFPPPLPTPIRIRPPMRFVIPGDRLYTEIRSTTPDLPYRNWTWTTLSYVPGTGSPTMDWTWIEHSFHQTEGFQVRFRLEANNDEFTGNGVGIRDITAAAVN